MLAGLLKNQPSDGDDLAVLLGLGDELAGQDQAAARVVPADERLEAQDRLIPQPHDRLVVDGELPQLQRLAHLSGQLETSHDGLLHHRGERLVAALAVTLGGIHGAVSIAHDLSHGLTLAGRAGDADAGTDDDLPVGDGDGCFEGRQDAIRGVLGGLGVGQVFEQECELVTTQPRRRIHGSHAAT